MKVERATPSDIDGLVELRMAYLAEDSGAINAQDRAALLEGLPRYFEAHLNRDVFGYVAREGGALAACALLLVVEKPMSPAFINGRTGTVLNVYTRQAFRRRGLARAVMRTLLDDAQRMGLCRVDLKSTPDGYRLYQSLGFADGTSKYRPMTWTPEG